MRRVLSSCADSLVCATICSDLSTNSVSIMQLSDTIGACTGAGPPTGDGTEPCRFPKLEECAHFHYERVQLPKLDVKLEGDMDKSLHSQHTLSSLDGTPSSDPSDYYTLQVTCRDECWLIQRSMDNFAMLDAQLHQCIYDRKVSQLEDLSELQKRKERNKSENDKDGEEDVEDEDGKADLESILTTYLDRLCSIIDNSLNCGPILNWFQLDNRGHRLLVPSEESRSINTPAVAAAYSVRKYVSQARDELSLEVGDMISVIDMASPGESVWWRGKRGFQVGFFPQHCVHIIGDKVPRNMPLPPPVVGSLAISPIKPVLRKHGKLITFFRSFILNRPSRRRLKQTGILKERVFGCDLGEHLLNSGHDIPMVLKCCAEFIESHGIVDGIYRLSGVTSNIQKLRNAFDEDRIPNLYTDDILQDIHSVASLLKMYFRELPNPLCTYQLYHSFVSAVQGCSASRNKANDNERLLKMREAVQKLPPPHYRTLEYLMRHLSRIAAHGARTGMTTRNVAIVWAPNLLRCEELEIGGVAALQGVGVQAVVTEFLVCYADLIFSERVPPMLEEGLTRLSNVEREVQVSPKRSRPKSLAISTPTKLLTLEEARNKHLLNKSDDGNYIEVGGGPKSLPKKYHTVIELPAGSRKRGLNKRSPSGWRSFFSKSRNSSHGNLSKREISSPGIIAIDKSVTESDLNDIKRKLRPVKSAESLTSGQSEPATCDADVLGPLHCLQKPSGHNRSVSHDSYFDNLQSSQNNSVGSLLDLSEIQLNFELEESEMRIFSEDESLVSSPKVQKESTTRKTFSRSRFDDNYSSCTNSSNPSPKKQPRVVLSPDSMSRKRSRLEDQLSDIQYIDCNTPENPCVISTTAQIHTHDDQPGNGEKIMEYEVFEGYQPKNKSPRNSSDASNRYSLNFEKIDSLSSKLPKSLTETDFKTQHSKSHSFNLTPTPQTPNYKPLDSTSTTNTPILSPSSENINNRYSNNFESLSPMDSRANFISSTSEERDLSSLNDDTYQNVYQNVPTNKRYSNNFDCIQLETKTNEIYENVAAGNSPGSPTYENILTTISIVYKSPVKSRNNSENIYEDIELTPEQAEKAVIPTTAASLPSQEASQPAVENITNKNESLPISINQESIENIETPSLSSLPSTPTNISAKVSLETTFDSSIITICSDSICVENTTLKQEDDSSDSSEQQNRPSDLQLFDKSKDDKSIDFNSTYRSIDSLSSASENTPDNISKKSLITPTEEVSFSEVEPKTSDTSSTATSPKLSTSSPEQSPILSPNVTNCTTQLSQLDITCADDSSLSQNINDNACGTFNVVKKRFGSTDTISSLINNQNKLITADKRKSCDAEILDDGTIYQQVKYFRRSIHEINSLIDDKPPEKNLIKPKSIHNSLNNLSETVNIDNITLDNLEFDSLETENIHLYENIEITKNNDNSRTVLDTSRIRMHENEPKKIDITPEVVQELPVCSKCCDTTDPVKGINVKNLTSKFESTKTDNNQTIQTPNQKIIKHNYDKDNLPPCLRAKNAKNSIKTRSLDENAFVTEFGRTNSNLQRRKSLDDRTSSYIDSKLLVDCVSKLSSVSTSDIRHDTKNTNRPSVESLYNTLGSEQKLNRERIEKYKEERRNFWREKYRSESFKEDKDKILSRLKQKSFKSTKSELDTLEYKNNDYKKLPQDTISKFENKPDGAINKTSSFRVKNTSPLFERKKKSSLKELSDKLLDESTDETCLLRVSKEDEFLRHRRSDGESERRRHTYDLLREREVDDRDRRVSLESKNPRKEKCSPSYCIKDMKAIFESKSQQ